MVKRKTNYYREYDLYKLSKTHTIIKGQLTKNDKWPNLT